MTFESLQNLLSIVIFIVIHLLAHSGKICLCLLLIHLVQSWLAGHHCILFTLARNWWAVTMILGKGNNFYLLKYFFLECIRDGILSWWKLIITWKLIILFKLEIEPCGPPVNLMTGLLPAALHEEWNQWSCGTMSSSTAIQNRLLCRHLSAVRVAILSTVSKQWEFFCGTFVAEWHLCQSISPCGGKKALSEEVSPKIYMMDLDLQSKQIVLSIQSSPGKPHLYPGVDLGISFHSCGHFTHTT